MLARGLVLLLLLAPAAQERRLSVPAWAGEALCTIGAIQQSLKPGAVVSIPCAGKKDGVSCNFDRAEPLDLPESDACNLPSLPVKSSIPVRIRTDTQQLAVEWLEVDAAGSLVLLATRELSINGEYTIQVAREANRLVRFVRKGASPVTVSAEELVTSSLWTLPAISQGGELVVHAPPSVVMPSEYVVTGAAQRKVTRKHPIESLAGLVPGAYTLTSVYSSGRSGSARSFKVTQAASTVLSIPPAQLGAARVTVSSNGCQLGDVLVLSSVEPGGANQSALVKPVSQVRLTDCVVLLDGIPPGPYKISLTSNGNTMVTTDLQVTAQQVSEVPLGLEPVLVTGRVTLNAKPFAGVTLNFVQLPGESGNRNVRDSNPASLVNPAGEGVKATTGSDGSYTVSLASAGSYAVGAKWGSAHIVGQDRELKVPSDAVGPVVLDVALAGGFLEFHVANWDRRTAVHVELRRSGQPTKPIGGTSIMGTSYYLAPGDTLPFRIPGIPFGDYLVSAQQLGTPTKVAPRQEVTLDKEHANGRVDLSLTEQHSTLRVVDDMGRPLDDVTVMGGVTKKNGPGEFDLSKVPPGARLHVKSPGFVPACRVVGTQGELHVELARGQSARVDYIASTLMREPDGFLELPGSDCLVNIFYFQFERAKEGPPEASSFVFTNFPMSGKIVTPSGVRVEIPPTNIWSLRWK
jgi:hypothetical protein